MAFDYIQERKKRRKICGKFALLFVRIVNASVSAKVVRTLLDRVNCTLVFERK